MRTSALRDEAAHEVLALFGPQVGSDRLLVAGHDRPPQRLAVGLLPAPLPHRVTVAGVLHLDHLGAEVAEELSAERSGQQLAELDDANVVQRQRGGAHEFPSSSLHTNRAAIVTHATRSIRRT